jgi:hypothetical protein
MSLHAGIHPGEVMRQWQRLRADHRTGSAEQTNHNEDGA